MGLLPALSSCGTGEVCLARGNVQHSKALQMSAIILLIRFLGGAFGGNLAGEILSNLNLGFFRNSVVGVVGGLIGGYVAQYAFEAGGRGELDPQNIFASLLGGIFGGGLAMVLAGWVKRVIEIVRLKGVPTQLNMHQTSAEGHISIISVEETGSPGRSEKKEQS